MRTFGWKVSKKQKPTQGQCHCCGELVTIKEVAKRNYDKQIKDYTVTLYMCVSCFKYFSKGIDSNKVALQGWLDQMEH